MWNHINITVKKKEFTERVTGYLRKAVSIVTMDAIIRDRIIFASNHS